jgi:hypothetical protein
MPSPDEPSLAETLDALEELRSKNGSLIDELKELDIELRDARQSLESARADNKALRDVNDKLKAAAGDRPSGAPPTGDYAFWRGEFHPITGDYRADNTFHHVKTRECDEGVALLAIPRPH